MLNLENGVKVNWKLRSWQRNVMQGFNSLLPQNGHHVFSRFFNVKLPDHLLQTEIALLFIHDPIAALMLQLHTHRHTHMNQCSPCSDWFSSTICIRALFADATEMYVHLSPVAYLL